MSVVTPAQATTFAVTSASATPEMVLPGQSVSLAASVRATAAASNMIVDLEIYNSGGTKLAQTFSQGQNFTAGQTRRYNWSYSVPASTAVGTYTLKLGIFTAGWASNPYWNNSVGTYQVETQSTGGGGGTGGQTPFGWPSNFVIGVSVWEPRTQFAYLEAAGEPKWGATYMYLSGGINSGWQTWGSGFVANFVNSARSGGFLPAFIYYMIVGSPPNPTDGHPQTDLNTPATMKAYFADFTALMKQLAAVGGSVVVDVEPDMWGYLEPRGLSQSVSVASSGNPDLASLPNTAAGLQQAYVTLRDKYAANVILASHVSTWFWNTNTNCSLNVVSIAATDAAFMAGANWDLYFTDIAFGDAGAPGGTWWDATNTKCPNFNVLNSWATAFTKNTGARLVLWQTPAGNTIYDTDNNTAWHYQDNRAQYWLQNFPGDGHLAALANAGVIGILFTGGESTPTDIYDAAGDGTTNPPAINGNTAMSTVPDDDGGGLRTWTLKYYSKPLALH
ncbi:MAG: hypothetical protein JO189_03265 [Deltaproteobacteria bacterium]|nr:hypothetical protein [Deltaproteobacteria bacterium]